MQMFKNVNWIIGRPVANQQQQQQQTIILSSTNKQQQTANQHIG